MELEFSLSNFGKKKKSNFLKISPVGAELIHADRQTDRHDEDKRTYKLTRNII